MLLIVIAALAIREYQAYVMAARLTALRDVIEYERGAARQTRDALRKVCDEREAHDREFHRVEPEPHY